MSKSEYYKEKIDWSKVKKGDPIEVTISEYKQLVYFISHDLDVVRFSITSKGHPGIINDTRCRPLDKSCIVREIDWSKVPVDTPCICDGEYKRHFARFDGDFVHCFDGGVTSWTNEGFTAGWRIDQVELAE